MKLKCPICGQLADPPFVGVRGTYVCVKCEPFCLKVVSENDRKVERAVDEAWDGYQGWMYRAQKWVK